MVPKLRVVFATAMVAGFILLLTTVGCDESSGGRGDPIGNMDAAADDASTGDVADGEAEVDVPGLEALRIEPNLREIVDDGVSPAETTSFRAIGIFEGEERDLTDRVAWSLDNDDLGDLSNGEFTSNNIGGRATVTALTSQASATAQLEVRLEVSATADGAPNDLASLFPESTDNDLVGDQSTLSVVYPSHETMFPRNLERVTYQWVDEHALDGFELRFESEVADVRYYTDKHQLLPDPRGWRWLANTHAGSSVELTVRGVSQEDPSTIYRSQTITIYFSTSEVHGALYYWSTGAQGVMKAHISAPVARKFFTDPNAEDQECVSCHTVSRNGRRLAVGYGGESLREVTIPDRQVLIPSDPQEDGPDYGWGTFNPSATRLLYANDGQLTLLDSDTGSVLTEVQLPVDMQASQPDWSPDGRYVALAYKGSKVGNKGVEGTSLARIPVLDGDTFGTPEILVESQGDDDTLFFPSYSPDSKYIAFVRGEGGSKDNETAKLFLVEADGGEPIELTRLNERVGARDGVIDIGNSMPTWAPSTRPDETFWLALSSLRSYGHVMADGGHDQLWAAAIDPGKIGSGSDASYAAFWLPFQTMDEGNHRAFWAHDTEEECPSDVEVCDNVDNDCDGVVDEDCCTVENEVCDDGQDNDCDGVVDEGCDCGEIEQCDNGIDDNCDGMIDMRDLQCQG